MILASICRLAALVLLANASKEPSSIESPNIKNISQNRIGRSYDELNVLELDSRSRDSKLYNENLLYNEIKLELNDQRIEILDKLRNLTTLVETLDKKLDKVLKELKEEPEKKPKSEIQRRSRDFQQAELQTSESEKRILQLQELFLNEIGKNAAAAHEQKKKIPEISFPIEENFSASNWSEKWTLAKSPEFFIRSPHESLTLKNNKYSTLTMSRLLPPNLDLFKSDLHFQYSLISPDDFSTSIDGNSALIFSLLSCQDERLLFTFNYNLFYKQFHIKLRHPSSVARTIFHGDYSFEHVNEGLVRFSIESEGRVKFSLNDQRHQFQFSWPKEIKKIEVCTVQLSFESMGGLRFEFDDFFITNEAEVAWSKATSTEDKLGISLGYEKHERIVEKIIFKPINYVKSGVSNVLYKFKSSIGL